MPLYEYHCSGCEATVEVLVRSTEEKPVCPTCGSKKLAKQLSVAALPALAGSRLPTTESPSGNCGRPQCGSGCMFE